MRSKEHDEVKMMSIFRDDLVGRLLWAEPDAATRFRYTIWFDYTRRLLNDLHEGDLVVVPNFATNSEGLKYSILQIISVFPRHYALGSDIGDLKGFPGFVMQAAKSASADWTDQESEPFGDTTKVICECIPTNFETDHYGNIGAESAMAMVGKDVNVVNTDMTNRIFNMGIDTDVEDVIKGGVLIRDENINIHVRVEDLIKTHFGIFGFTGVGKSNLVSTMVSNLLKTNNPIKIVLFDLMDEYTGLLADQLFINDGRLICLGEKTLMKPIFDYVNYDYNLQYEKEAVEKFIDTLLLPKGLKKKEIIEKYKKLAPHLLKKVRIKEHDTEKVSNFIKSNKSLLFHSSMGIATRNEIKTVLKLFEPYETQELTPKLAKELMDQISNLLTTFKKSTAIDRVEGLNSELKEIANAEDKGINPHIQITTKDLLKELSDDSKSGLYIITSHDPDKIREYAHKLGTSIFENRRLKGRFTPTVCFVFDEADEFMPGSSFSPKDDSYKLSRTIIETLARRGRKFGLGLGIATQRSAYLDTKTIGQLHTYFISKLPRKNDRDVVASAFGISEDQLTQTFKFLKGHWLLVSHDATGIDMPIPIKTDNAEMRIKKFLNE